MLVRVSVAEIKHHSHKQLGEGSLFQLTLPGSSPSLRKVRAGTQAGLASGGKS